MLDKYLAGKTSQEEEQVLIDLYESFPEEDWDEQVLGTVRELEDKIYRRLQRSIRPEVSWSRPWRKAAAVLLPLILAGGVLLWLNRPRTETPEALPEEARFKNDVEPGGDKAVLTLADGSRILLDEAQNGVLARQGGATVTKTAEGQVIYDESGQPGDRPTPPESNTISTPRGGQYRVVLPDGSKVWLNSASSLRFPAAFTGPARQVELDGEAYFEVARKENKPFRVLAGGVKIAVLGTRFNIMSYANEGSVKTTLLEGSVEVSKGAASALLKPGQQASVNNRIQIRQADPEEVLAWKNGEFYFNAADLKSIMRLLERWYDVEADMDSMPDRRFNGVISRDVNLSQVLKMLELTSPVRFKIEAPPEAGQERRISVMK